MKRRDFLKIATGSAGGAAAIGAVGARSSSTPAAFQEGEENNTTSGNGTEGNATTGADGQEDELPGAGTTETVAVGPNGENIFDPDTVYVQRGATVEWVWESTGHNVHATDVPEDAEWDVQTELNGPGFTYSYTFDGPPGEYHYVCDPHEAVGMVADIIVNETGEPPGGDGGGGGGGAELHPEEMGVPIQAHFVGIATFLMMLVSLVYTFFVLKYGESQHTSAPNKE